MATWREAIDNVIAGNVALSDNHRFSFVNYESSYQYFKFLATPSIVLNIDLTEGVGAENYITFKDGSTYGFYFSGYTGNQINFDFFAKIEDYPIIGTTPKGTSYTWTSGLGGAIARYFDVSIASQTIQAEIKKVALSFGLRESDTEIQAIIYPTFADNLQFGYRWIIDYDASLPDANHVGMGYPNENSHIVEYLAGDYAELHYPGDAGNITGGNGNYYADNDGVPFSHVPALQLIDLGFNTIYNPSEAEARQISEWLWSDDFSDNIKMNYVSPFENIVLVASAPIKASDLSLVNAPFKIGNTYMRNGSQYVTMNKVNNQYLDLSCGSRTIDGFWDGFLDYDATYTLYLPFIGFRSLKTDDIVNSHVYIKYNVDLLTGNAVAEVGVIPFDPVTKVEDKFSTLYSFPCNIYYNMAISGANFTSMYAQQLSATSSGINNAVSGLGQMASGNPIGALTGLTQLLTGSAQAKMQYDTAKPDYGRGGNNSGNSGLFSCRYPYIIQSLPITQSAENYNALQGVPLQLNSKLEDLSGYTEIEAVITDTLNSCTSDEKRDIIALLKGGVIL